MKAWKKSAAHAAGAMILAAGIAVSAQAEELTIGVVGPLTGPAANSGIATLEGVMLAVEEANAAGGIVIGGETLTIELISEDSQSRPEIGVSAAQKLMERDHADLVLGDLIHSSVAIAMMEVSDQYRRPIVSVQPVSSEISKKIATDPERYGLFWKGNFDSSAYAQAIFQTLDDLAASGKLGAENKTVAFLLEDTDNGQAHAQNTTKLFEEGGWEVVAVEMVPIEHTDYYPQLSKLRSLQPAAIVSALTASNSGIALARQYQEQAVEAIHFGIYYPSRPEFQEQTGDAREGMLWTPLLYDPENNADHAAFEAKVSARFEKSGTVDQAFGYCFVQGLLKAMATASDREPESLSKVIGAMDHACFFGRWKFDPQTHTALSGPDYLAVPTAQVQSGKNVAIWPPAAATADYAPRR